MTYRRLGAWCLAVVVVGGVLFASASPEGATPKREQPRRVLVLSLPAVVWSDLSERYLPNLDALFADSAVANLSTRAPSLRADLVSGYATVGAGDKATAGRAPDDGAAYDAHEDVDGEVAADLFARRTGIDVETGLVHLGVPELAATNESSLWRAHLGALGDALDRAGYARAVIANGDGTERGEPSVPRRAAVAALMGADGTVPGGSVSDHLLRRDAGAPFGIRLDHDAVVDAFRRAWTDRSVVLVEASDLVRADAYANRQTPVERAATLDHALADTDRLVGDLLRDFDPATDAVVVVGPAPSRAAGGLTVAALRAPGVRAGLMRSGTTQRAGYVQLMDVAPTILDVLGVHRPASMRGRPFTVAPSTSSAQALRATLVDGNEAAQFRALILTPVAIGFTALVAGLLLAAVFAIVGARRGRRRGVQVLPWLALGTLGFVAAVYLARLVPFHHLGLAAFWAFLAAVSVAFAAAMWWGSRRRPLDALIAGLASLVALLVGDVVLGSHLQFANGFGFSPEVAGRFIGFGNVSYAVLASASVLLAGLLAYRVRGRRGAALAVAVLGIAVVADGAPFWGADVGGVLTMVPAFALAAVLLFHLRVRIRTLLLLVGATLGALTLATIADLSRPASSRTHLARLVEQIGGEGSSAFTTVLHRKLEMSLSTLSSSQWRPMVPLVLAFVAFLVWGPGRRVRAAPRRRPAAARGARRSGAGRRARVRAERPGHRRARGDAGRAAPALGAARGRRAGQQPRGQTVTLNAVAVGERRGDESQRRAASTPRSRPRRARAASPSSGAAARTAPGSAGG